METGYQWSRKISFYETDAMGIVHHSNYLRIFEEARAEWLRETSFFKGDETLDNINFAVLETQVTHKLPIYFNDKISVFVKMQVDKLKLRYKYAISTHRFENRWVAEGATVHVPVNKNMKPVRLPRALREAMEKESWIDI